jgi:hypothetical protein
MSMSPWDDETRRARMSMSPWDDETRSAKRLCRGKIGSDTGRPPGRNKEKDGRWQLQYQNYDPAISMLRPKFVAAAGASAQFAARAERQGAKPIAMLDESVSLPVYLRQPSWSAAAL